MSRGDITFTRNAVVGTLSHEIGHVLSLSHINEELSVQPTFGAAPIMGTGAIDLANQLRLTDREFSLTGFNAQSNNVQVFHIQQLVDAVGRANLPDNSVTITSIEVVSGTSAGKISDLEKTDKQFLSFLPNEPSMKGSSVQTQFVLTAILPTNDPPAFNIEMDSQTNTPNLIQTIELFNFQTEEFEGVETRPIAPPSNLISLQLTENVENFVDIQSCEIKCRLTTTVSGPTLIFPWRIDHDRINFSVDK